MIHLRIATIHDASILFEFVNEAESLKWKIRTTHPIKWHEHQKWLGSRLNNKNCFIYSETNLESVFVSSKNIDPKNALSTGLKEGSTSLVNLKGANLSRADLTGANLYGANLNETNLTGVNMKWAHFCKTTLAWGLENKDCN